jgi:hypothetical protein
MSEIEDLVPPEPLEIKNYVLEVKSRLGRESTIDWEPFSRLGWKQDPELLVEGVWVEGHAWA